MKKIATSTVAAICNMKSCVRERISRNVQMIKLIQNITRKATIKPILIPKTLLKVSSKGLPVEVAAKATKLSAITDQRPFQHRHSSLHSITTKKPSIMYTYRTKRYYIHSILSKHQEWVGMEPGEACLATTFRLKCQRCLRCSGGACPRGPPRQAFQLPPQAFLLKG